MSKVVLDEAGKEESVKYQVGDLFRIRNGICILLRTDNFESDWYMIPVEGDFEVFSDSFRWATKILERKIADGFAVRLPKGSSITITQE